jgi:D-3-phosphoglycerate dehydrogenase
MQPGEPDVNMVSAPIIAQGKGHRALRGHHAGQDRRLRRLHQADREDHRAQTRSIAGTVFSDGKPRFIQIKGINIDAEIGQHMLYTTNTDVPGIIGFMGSTLGDAGVNIANFQLGREKESGNAIALLYVDGRTSLKLPFQNMYLPLRPG